MKRPFLKRKPIILTPKELVDELSRREGVWHDMVTPNGRYEIHIIDDREDITKKDFGPARILVVKE